MAEKSQTHESWRERGTAKRSSERSFGVVFAIVFTIVSLWPMIAGGSPRWWALAIAVGFAIAGLALPMALRWPNALWFRFGLLLNRVISPVVLGLIYYLSVVPIGFAMRLAGKNPLLLGFEPESRSYWIKRDPAGPAAETLKNQF
jgi:predicted membrane metal-binding protein